MNKIALFASAALIALGSAASAATLSIVGGAVDAVPFGGSGAQPGSTKNDVLEALSLGSIDALTGFRTLDGYAGGAITLNVDAKIKIEVYGWEAAYVNTFQLGGVVAGKAAGDGSSVLATDVATPLQTFVTGTQSAGLLDFIFDSIYFNSPTSTGPVASVANNIGGALGSLTDGSNVITGAANFIASFGPGAEADTSGQSLWLFYDDQGVINDNHDDLVVRITALPLPAGSVLLLSGLGALALRRKLRG